MQVRVKKNFDQIFICRLMICIYFKRSDPTLWWLIDSIMHLDCDDSFIPSLHVPQSQQTQSSSTNDSPDRTWESRYKYIPLHPTLNKTSAFLLSLCNLWFWEWALISQRERNRQRERYGRRRRRRRRGEQKNPDIGCYRLHREVHSSCRAIAGPSHLRSHQILHHRLQTRPCPIPPICRHLHPPGQKKDPSLSPCISDFFL